MTEEQYARPSSSHAMPGSPDVACASSKLREQPQAHRMINPYSTLDEYRARSRLNISLKRYWELFTFGPLMRKGPMDRQYKAFKMRLIKTLHARYTHSFRS